MEINISLERYKCPVFRWPGKQAIRITDGLSDGAIRAHLRASEKHHIQLRRLWLLMVANQPWQ
jgi:hypothetical protein